MSPINTALCSFGLSGQVFHAPLISSEPSLYLHTIMQRSQDHAKDFYPEARIAKTFEQILQNKEIQLVVVNTPNALHYPMVKAALLADKHVVVEKPFTLTAAEAEELIKLAKQRNLILSVFHNKRLESDHLTLKKVLEDKLLGRLVEVEWHYDRYRTHITHKQWKEDLVPGSGTWYDLGVHLIDSMLQLFGKPVYVNADMRSLRRHHGSVDYFNVRYDYPDFRVILRSSTYVREPGPVVAAHGEKGSFMKYVTDPQEDQLKEGLRPGMEGWAKENEINAMIHTEIKGEIIRKHLPVEKGCYEKYYQNISAAIQGKEELIWKPEQALAAIQLLERAIHSNELRQTLEI